MGHKVISTVRKSGTAEVTEFNHPDRLGTRVVTNQASNIVSEQAHLPFGTALNAESTTSQSKRFTSYDRSAATGLDYAVNRTYDSKQGRFTQQVDPIGMGGSSLIAPQTLNLYSYVGNDPINHTDPSGLFWGFFKKLFKWILVAVTVVVAIITIVGAPATIIGILNAISAGAGAAAAVSGALGYQKVARAFGIIAVATGFGAIIAGKIGARSFASGGDKIDLSGAWFGVYTGVGAIANSFAQTKKKRRRYPCAPTVSKLIAQFGGLLRDLLENDSGHQTDSPLENGGWIYQKKNGELFFLRAEKFGGAWRRGSGAIDLNNPPQWKNARVIARAHTHPYTLGEQAMINSGAYGGPSSVDTELSISGQLPSLVAHQSGVTDDNRRLLTVQSAASPYVVWRKGNECKY